MITTSALSTPTGGACETEVRPKFKASSLNSLIDRINSDPGLLDRDWRDLVSAEFQHSAEQARTLEEVKPERAQEIGKFLREAAKHIRAGGTIKGIIRKLPAEEQTPIAVHEVWIELVEVGTVALSPQRLDAPQALRIAHCDADCRNWGWG